MRTVFNPSPADYKFTLLYYMLTLFFECLSSYKRNKVVFFFSIKQYNRSHCKQFCALFTGVSGNSLLNKGLQLTKQGINTQGPQLPHSQGLNLLN